MTTPYSIFQAVKASLTPLLKESRFLEAGVLTPEEFVLAGSYLVYKCPTWSWQDGNAEKRVSYLPVDKQFLVSHHVPSLRRVKDMYDAQAETEVPSSAGTEAWTAVEDRSLKNKREEAPVIDSDEDPDHGFGTMETVRSLDDVPDMDNGLDDEEDEVVDMAYYKSSRPVVTVSKQEHSKNGEKPNVLRTRTYSIYITYDKAYQVPRFWLSGFNENGDPLPSQRILEDISQDHALKTVTIEQFPHETWVGASIHPCKHASVMQTLLQRQQSSTDTAEPLQVDHYLFYFLKFMNSVVPTIEYDFTQ